MRIERLRQNYKVEMRRLFFPLHPETPQDGLALEDLFEGRGYDLNAMYLQMKSRMDAEGLAYGQRSHTYNSRLAQELAKWADTQFGYEAIHDELFKAYFVDGRNISELVVLVEVAESVGLRAHDTREILNDRLFAGAVDADYAKARRYGVTSVPTYACIGQGIVGAQSYEILEDLILKAGAELSLGNGNEA